MIKEKKQFSRRKLFNDIHLWLGIGSGLILFLVCLSGTLYTFRSEIEELLEPEKYEVVVPENGERLRTEEIIERAGSQTGGVVYSVEIPVDKSKTYRLNIKKSPEERRGTNYMVDPYTAEVKGSAEGPATGFFMSMFRLHRWLLLDQETGRPIVGAATIIFAFLILTGLVLWWPKKIKNWKQGLKVKTDANWKRVNHDLHNTLGFYTFPLLLVMCLTGLCWSFNWYRDGLSSVLGTKVFGGRGEQPLKSDVPEDSRSVTPLPLASFIHTAGEVLPYDGDYRISLPDTIDAAVVIHKSRNDFFAVSAADKIYFDRYSGEVLKLEKFSDKPLNVQIAASVKPLHTGEFYGTFSKILYFVSCLIATTLPVTGTIIWINKLKKKSKKAGKNISSKEVSVAG